MYDVSSLYCHVIDRINKNGSNDNGDDVMINLNPFLCNCERDHKGCPICAKHIYTKRQRKREILFVHKR